MRTEHDELTIALETDVALRQALNGSLKLA
jgi:hypothetical protein